MDTMKWISSLAVVLLAVCAFVKQGVSLTCYMCNSAQSRNGKLCELLTGDPRIFEQNCDHLPDARNHGVNYTVCRKMFQTIADQEGYDEERIIRQCGTEGPLECLRRTRTNTLQVEFCHCDTDLCNAATSNKRSSLFAVSTAALCIVFGLVKAYLL
ncbi:uncharacterized protein [Littorina saxatilis]|uniref:uncharacterized protein n=1 Tax=Littorina saxatilis TaxID=31220 RepID=UPI0038B4D57A